MRGLLLAAALLAAGPAFADDADPAAAAAAQALIDQGEAQGHFNVVPGPVATVRHPASGLVCRFENQGAEARIVLFPQLRRGDNVACDEQDGRRAVTLYATRYPMRTTLREQIEIAESAILRRFADAAAFTDADEANAGLAVPATHVRHIVTWNGARSFTRASVAIVGDWVIKMRYSAFAADDAAARAAEADATQVFLNALRDLEAPGNL